MFYINVCDNQHAGEQQCASHMGAIRKHLILSIYPETYFI